MEFIAALINGLSSGGTYAIIALGYTMVYGIAKMLNFAHGDIIMVGGYAMFVTLMGIGQPLVALAAAIVFCVILGICVERFAYKPLRGASPRAVLVTAVGVCSRLPSLAQTTPLRSRVITIKLLRTTWRTPPIAIPPSSIGKLRLLPIATISSGIASDDTEYIVNAENPA